jgi:hypothetical protein
MPNDNVGRDRRPQQIALGQQITGFPQPVELSRLFNTLYDHIQIQGASQREECLHDSLIVTILSPDTRSKCLVELQDIDRQHAQVLQRGIPSPKIIKRDPNPQTA